MLNLDTGTAIALTAEGSTVRYQLRQYIQAQQMVMTQTAVREFTDIMQGIGGNREQGRAERLLKRVTIVADNPSARALTLHPTKRLGENDIIILGTGDQLAIVSLTADAKAVKAALAQGVNFNVYLHPPYPLTGN